ncbi:hypothetical protein Gogos_004935 [Gossypium gossypioides]|uniref:DUF4283 domain-containing protein n=1 Tax=Gossypium gossypioides TaxID=34282 RepID=A0A7J9CHW4_GOSGO|nr:hypothetical protein [Gossypium gossypioides]
MAKVSYKAKLLGDETGSSRNVSMKEDFELKDENVVTEMVNGIPSITFSDCVQRFIEKEMALSIVIKLIGRKIAFSTLLNKDKDEFDGVLLGSPLMVFGNYLSMKVLKLANHAAVVWIRLPGLSEGVYSKSLLGAIGSMIGPVGKPDTMVDVVVASDSGVEKVTDFEAMEGIVRNLHRDREWFNVESLSLNEGKSLEMGFNRGVRISGSCANEVISELGYPNSCRIEANGFSGGI